MKFRISSHRSRETEHFGGKSMGKWTQVQGFKYMFRLIFVFPLFYIVTEFIDLQVCSIVKFFLAFESKCSVNL